MTQDIPDLLPQSVRNERVVVRTVRNWVIVWVVTALLAWMLWIHRSRHVGELQLTAARLAARAAPVKTLQNEVRQLQQQIASIRERESWLIDADSQQTLQLMGIISRAAAATNGRISVSHLTLTTIERVVERSETKTKGASPRAKQKPETEQRVQVDLNGIAVDDLAVAAFVSGLQEGGVFESVELKSSASRMHQNHETRDYTVTCIY